MSKCLWALLTTSLLLSTTSSPAVAKDPSCNASGVAQIFQNLKNCERLYCGDPKIAGTPAALKLMDQTFTAHKAKRDTVWSLVTQYHKIFCEQIIRLKLKSGPIVDKFRTIGFDLQDEVEDLQKLGKEIEDFEPTMDAVNRVEIDLVCFRQIKDLRTEAQSSARLAIESFHRTSSDMCK